jgi:hypothetical protein
MMAHTISPSPAMARSHGEYGARPGKNLDQSAGHVGPGAKYFFGGGFDIVEGLDA